MRYTIPASITAAALTFAIVPAGAQTKAPDTSTNVTTSTSEKMNPQGDLGAGVSGSASSQAHSAGARAAAARLRETTPIPQEVHASNPRNAASRGVLSSLLLSRVYWRAAVELPVIDDQLAGLV
jgi:hypothetical protein